MTLGVKSVRMLWGVLIGYLMTQELVLPTFVLHTLGHRKLQKQGIIIIHMLLKKRIVSKYSFKRVFRLSGIRIKCELCAEKFKLPVCGFCAMCAKIITKTTNNFTYVLDKKVSNN